MTDSNFDPRNHKCKIGDNSSQLKALSHRREKHAWSFHTGRFLTLESWITASELQVLWHITIYLQNNTGQNVAFIRNNFSDIIIFS